MSTSPLGSSTNSGSIQSSGNSVSQPTNAQNIGADFTQRTYSLQTDSDLSVIESIPNFSQGTEAIGLRSFTFSAVAGSSAGETSKIAVVLHDLKPIAGTEGLNEIQLNNLKQKIKTQLTRTDPFKAEKELIRQLENHYENGDFDVDGVLNFLDEKSSLKCKTFTSLDYNERARILGSPDFTSSQPYGPHKLSFFLMEGAVYELHDNYTPSTDFIIKIIINKMSLENCMKGNSNEFNNSSKDFMAYFYYEIIKSLKEIYLFPNITSTHKSTIDELVLLLVDALKFTVENRELMTTLVNNQILPNIYLEDYYFNNTKIDDYNLFYSMKKILGNPLSIMSHELYFKMLRLLIISKLEKDTECAYLTLDEALPIASSIKDDTFSAFFLIEIAKSFFSIEYDDWKAVFKEAINKINCISDDIKQSFLFWNLYSQISLSDISDRDLEALFDH
jgi:hypothetical protein